MTGSTDDVPVDRRLAHWEDVIAQVHLRMEIVPKAETPFSASLFSVSLDGVNLIQVTTTAHSARQRSRAKDDDGQERCLLVAAQRGRLILRQEQREMVLNPGDMALLDSRVAPAYAAPDRVVFLGVSFPRDALTLRIGGLEHMSATFLPDHVPLHRFTYQYLERLFALAPEIEVPELFRLKNHVLDLLAVTTGSLIGKDAAGSGYKTALVHRIREFVEERLHDPALGLGTVAEQFRVTPRYVTQLFRDDGGSFNSFVRDQRLERCRRLLELSRAGAPSIGAIAASVGFGSQAYLNKAFRRRFGMTPGDYRRDFQRRADAR